MEHHRPRVTRVPPRIEEMGRLPGQNSRREVCESDVDLEMDVPGHEHDRDCDGPPVPVPSKGHRPMTSLSESSSTT